MNKIKEKQTEDRLHGEESASLRLWVILARCFSAVAEQDRKSIARFDLIPTEFGVLDLLAHQGPVPLSDIGKRLLLTSGSITYVIDKLERRGWIRRVPCPDDRRVIYAHLTDEGREAFAEVFPRHAARMREVLSGLNAEEREIAMVLLKKLGRRASGAEPTEHESGR